MADPLASHHKAIFTALESGLTQDVYDYVPQNASYPYVEVGRHVTIQDDSLVAKKDSVTTYLTVWSEYKGQKEVLEIMEAIYAILHQVSLPLDSGTMVRCFVDSRTTARDTDDQTFTGNVKLFTLLEH